MLKKTSIALSALLIVSCASTKTVKMDQQTTASLQDKSVALTASARPDFAAMTAGKAMFAVVGAFAMISAGNEIVRKYDVQDPAIYIAEKLGDDLQRKLGAEVKMPVMSDKNDDASYLIGKNPGQDYILDVRTINWSFGYYPTDWDNYRVIYSAKLKLIDAGTGHPVAEAFCARVPEQTPSSPTYDQLLANHAARLKQALHTAADQCVDEFRQKIF